MNFSSQNLSRSFFIFVLTLISTSNCTTNFNPGALIKTNALPASNPNTGSSDGSNQGAFLITRVSLDRTYSSLINVVGDQSGAIGNFCSPTNGQAGNATADTGCMCTYAYNSPSAPNQQIDVPVIYQETDMVRCPVADVPGDATEVSVSIHVTAADLYSNSLIYTSGSSTNIIDTTDINSWVQVIRYQCQDKVWIPYIFDNTIYDPYQSENPHLSYPLDFYTTNLATSMALYAGGVDQFPGLEFWDCPPILTPSEYLSHDPANEEAFSNRFNLNMRIYSWNPLEGDSIIYPPQPGSPDRSTFYLAKESSGAFTIPVNAYIAPLIVSDTDPKTNPPLGYGARPVISGADGSDTCPPAPIPDGFTYVKVWLFRAALPARQYFNPGDSGDSLNSINSIMCNPGTWPDPDKELSTQEYLPIFKSCNDPLTSTNPRVTTAYDYVKPSPSPSAKFIMNKGWDQRYYLTSRVITYDSTNIVSSTSCVNLQNPGANTPQACAAIPSTPLTDLGLKPGTGCGGDNATDFADFWETASPQTLAGINANTGYDPLKIHNTPTNASGVFHTPRNSIIKTQSIDSTSNRYDFLFVVSPPGISLTSMVDTSPTSPGRPYQPYRFYLLQDCTSNRPNDSSDTDCNKETNAITTYGVKRHDVKTNGDTPPNDTTIPWVFPVCAIQPISKK